MSFEFSFGIGCSPPGSFESVQLSPLVDAFSFAVSGAVMSPKCTVCKASFAGN